MTTSDYLTQLQQDRQDLADNLETKGITGLTGDETFTELVPEVLNIPSGGDLSEYYVMTPTSSENTLAKLIKKIPAINTSNITSMSSMFRDLPNLEEIELMDTSNVTTMFAMFTSDAKLTTIPLFNTANVTNMSNMFSNCTNLTEIPQLNTANVSNMSNMFFGCQNLTNLPLLDTSSVTNFSGTFNNMGGYLTSTSLDNILQMCINASSYTGTKTLSTLGFTAYYVPSATIQALPHYQDFIDAGWTIGY